jgi:hypothetical protein
MDTSRVDVIQVESPSINFISADNESSHSDDLVLVHVFDTPTL